MDPPYLHGYDFDKLESALCEEASMHLRIILAELVVLKSFPT
jgi:hypothetical protein